MQPLTSMRTWSLKDIVDPARVQAALEAGRHADPDQVRLLIAKAREKRGLTVEETAILLCQDQHPELVAEVLEAAREVKEAIYGKRLVFFAPLYISNYCVNNCLYCAYRRDNRELARRRLSPQEIAQQVEALEDQGHKRLLLVAGETERFPDVLEALKVIYATRKQQGEIRRVNVNLAPPTVEQFRQLKAVGIGTYQCFQETYHPETYARMHPDGPKADYTWRLTVMDRALEAGVDDVSTGVLLGLYDYRFDVTALIQHAHYLDDRYRVGPHAVSVPRLRVAHGTPLCDDATLTANRYLITDEQFKLVVGVIRLALPYAGLILSTRESSSMRQALMNAGISQLSAGSHTEVGGYADAGAPRSGQFEVEDTRSLDEVVQNVIASGNLSSFCTACYRVGRTGETIMDLLKPGTIKTYCLPNAILTFKEYLLDYASPLTRAAGESVIEREVQALEGNARQELEGRLKRLESGERDLFY